MATPSLSEETAKAVLRQVEFYFSDSNIPRDGFLKKKISESEDGMVSLALICSFAKMRNHLKLAAVKAEDVPEDTVKAVAETLRTSSSLKVSEDGKRVGRIAALLEPEELLEQLDSRTIAASPFECNIKREDVEAFFNQHAKVTSVRLPHLVAHKKFFCGTALIEFSTEEDAQKVLGQSLVFAGAELELKPKKDFDVIREQEVVEFEAISGSNGDNDTNEEEKYPKGLLVAFALKSTSSGDSTEQKGSDEVAKDGADANKTDGGPDSGNAAGSNEQESAEVGEEKGYIRFDEPEAAQKARAAAVLAKEGGLAVMLRGSIGVYFVVTKRSTRKTSAFNKGEEGTTEVENTAVAMIPKEVVQTKLEGFEHSARAETIKSIGT
ncbi:Lupus La protein [Corchorus olitorius]|uniref:Lupus La protein n=1 Tax=Corchorus olitorius TaxID=93759 RepID=A0A1R3J8B9_9ROSI|nr:Lupus La protein [Corchorus olitorius]